MDWDEIGQGQPGQILVLDHFTGRWEWIDPKPKYDWTVAAIYGVAVLMPLAVVALGLWMRFAR
jgi:nitroreductase